MRPELGTPKSIETPFLRIRENCLEIQNTTIQLSNISLFSTADVAPEKFPLISIPLIIGGIAFLVIVPIPALIAIAFGGFLVYVWYSSVQKAKEMKRLTIITNSGNTFPIVFNNQAFLAEVVTLMTETIRDPSHARNITINVKDCTFWDDSHVLTNMHE